MSAPALVSKADIRRALEMWRGVVADAARAVAISETAFRKRMKAMGIGQEALLFLRSPNHRTQPQPTMPIETPPVATKGHNHSGSPNRPPKTSARNYPRPVESPTLPSVSTDVVVKRAPARPPKLRPEQVDVLREARIDINFKTRGDETEEDVLHRFFAEAFPDWLKRTLGREKKEKA
jgi:hypothetical protein